LWRLFLFVCILTNKLQAPHGIPIKVIEVIGGNVGQAKEKERVSEERVQRYFYEGFDKNPVLHTNFFR